jgi:hypothetical protein
VALDFPERVPGEFATGKNHGVFGLVEVKQVGWLEHGGKLIESGAAEKGNGAGLPFAAARVFSPWSVRPRSSNG